MQSKSKKEAQPRTISQLWFVILIVTVGWSRYLPLSHPELYNFTPVLALFFISGTYLRGHLSWIGPVIAVIVSDLVLNPNYGMGLLEPFTLISIFAYWISPDSSPNPNQMNLNIHSNPPGFSTFILKIPQNLNVDNFPISKNEIFIEDYKILNNKSVKGSAFNLLPE